MPKTKDAIAILERVTGNNAELKAGIATARIDLQVAQLIYAARIRAGLSQKQLDDLIGSKHPVIASLEDAEYEGHSLSMPERIAAALTQA